MDPFDPAPAWGSWFHIMVPSPPAAPNYVWNMAVGTGTSRPTEPFAFHWASLMTNYLSEGNLGSKVQFSPGDVTVLQRFNTLTSTPGFDPTTEIWDGSYWYSPTCWTSPARYMTDQMVPMSFTPTYLRRNRLDDVTSPQAKVILFERFDFTSKTRTSGTAGGGREPYPPQFNHPDANARYMLADGSVDTYQVRKIYALANSSDIRTRDEFTPSGLWAMPAAMMTGYDMANDNIEYGQANAGTYPAFFWATRKGLHGRDINR